MAETRLNKITIEETARLGKSPVVIWVPEWVEPHERKKYFVKAAKEKAREMNIREGIFESVSGRDLFGEYLELIRDIPGIISFAAKLVYNHYKRELFSPSEKGLAESFSDYVNRMAREAM